MSEVFHRLKTEFPGVKLLALGQTVYWDEPMKAILRRHLNEQYPECRMIIGIHDADYFSKIPSNPNLQGWGILPHNDGSTRDLWAATGEISAFFGSETIPTRELLTSHGVRLDKIAKDFPAGRDGLIDMATEAWGWRGLVHTDSGTEIACCIPLSDALPQLIELLEWGFHHTLDALSDVDCSRGRRVADELISEVHDYADSHPDSSTTDMFREFLIRFYERFLGTSENLEVSSASRLFTFNRSTADFHRFNLLGAFLNPQTRMACQEAYDLAVRGSDTYTLDRFPPGAIPFDLVVPGKGRGTICLRDSHVVIDMDEPITLPGALPSTPEELAALIEGHFGPEVGLVGKALTLVLMMSSEFIFVLHEQASAYVPRCRKMAALMKERGVNLSFYPILRINYHTWDCLSACDATFRLPGHLAAAFHQGEITSREFADSWQSTVREQEELLKRIAATTNLDELLAFLIEQQADPWRDRIETHMNAYATVLDLSERAKPLKDESVRLRDLSHAIKQEVQQLEIEKGEHFRQKVKPLKDEMDRLALEGKNDDAILQELRSQEEVRAELEKQIEAKREEANQAHNRSLQLKHEVQSLEKGEEALNARRAVNVIEYEAELARLWLVRDAILVSQGLTYTNHRPPAWWFLMVDPELKWFNEVSATAEFRFEEIA